MKAYGKFQPTEWDSRSNYIGDDLIDRRDWLVAPCGHNRDSRILDESNWAYQLTVLGEVGEEGEENGWELHRFGHWACGWYEIVIVAPNSKAYDVCKAIEDRLDNYPILDEDDVTTREYEYAVEYWQSMTRSERIELCRELRIPTKGITKKWLPDDDDGRLWERLTCDAL